MRGFYRNTSFNITKSIYEIFTKKHAHNYFLDFFHDEFFTHAYRLMHRFLCRTCPIKIYAEFIPNKDHDSRCFKIINAYYLKYISEKEK